MTIGLRKTILIFGDIAILYSSLILTLFFGFNGKISQEILQLHFWPFSTLYFIWLLILYVFDLHSLNTTRDKMLFYPRLAQALITCLVVGIALFYLWPALGITPKTNLLLNIVFFGGLLLLWRRIFYGLFSKRLLTSVAILGAGPEASRLAWEILKRPYLGYKLKKIYGSEKPAKTLPSEIPFAKLQKNFLDQVQKDNIEILILSENILPQSQITEMLYKCLEARIDFWDLSFAFEKICGKIPVISIDKTWFLENLQEGKKAFFDKSKRIFDLLFASLLLILTFPLWGIIALSIKIEDRGQIFYRQRRIGKDRKTFWLWKFRSMRQDAEKKGAVWAKDKDSRITKIGKILRYTHTDELPQTINVLKGDISLVGPRPERPEFVKTLEKEVPFYHLRHLIKPGITGWNQIKFKYARTIEDSLEKLEYDLYYLKNRNLLLDCGILLKTFQSFFRKGE